MLNKFAIALSVGFIALSGAAVAQQSGGVSGGDRPTAVECQRPVHMAGCDTQTNPNQPDYR
jgi:hypothetical protein